MRLSFEYYIFLLFHKTDGVVKTLHILRHYKFNVITTYLSTPHSIKFAFLEYEVLGVCAYLLSHRKFYFFKKNEIDERKLNSIIGNND